MVCDFKGKFSLLIGANGSGKTTLNEAIALAHPFRFPRLASIDAAALGPLPRSVSVEYEYESGSNVEGALGQALQKSGYPPPQWDRPLERSLGRVRAGVPLYTTRGYENLRLIYLPALRNPVDELSRRDAQVLLELLRAEQLRSGASIGMASVRAQAQNLLASLAQQPLLQNLQDRIAKNLQSITIGVQEHYPYIGTQQVNDAYLARVLEILLATLPDPASAVRLEAASLGYVNLLHIAVTLAGIPSPSDASAADADPVEEVSGENSGEDGAAVADMTAEEARALLDESDTLVDNDQDSFYPDLFHATVLIEEPEAHLHPQLQYGLVRYLRQVARERKDLQIIVTSHSGELAAACDPEELVIARRDRDGRHQARSLNDLPVSADIKRRLFQQTRLHMDANRSGALFADRLLVVEGVTEGALLRVFGRHWASSDVAKRAFVDSLAIFPVGHKIGEWPMQLLASPNFGLVHRVAALSDTDARGTPLPEPTPPSWHSRLDPAVGRFFWSRPTLEPSLVTGNEAAIGEALDGIGVPRPASITADTIDALFQGSAKRHKGAFSLALAAAFDNAVTATLPEQIEAVFDWLYTGDDGSDETSPSDLHSAPV